MTSFTKYINGNPIYADPNTAEQAYNYMNGLVGTSGDPYLDHNGEATVFVHSGDPTTGTGWIDEEPADSAELIPRIEVSTFLVEDLDTSITPVGHKQSPLRIHRQRVWSPELARPVAPGAPGFD